MSRLLNRKPGSEKARFAPDRIERYRVPDTPAPAAGPDAPAAGRTLLPTLVELMPQRSRTTAKQLLSHRQVAVNGVPVTRHDHPLAPGDEVSVNLVRPFAQLRHPRLRLVYEDDDIIVVDKGYGLLSVATDRSHGDTVYSILRAYLKWSDPSKKLFIVHRLDRDTTGLMVLAKNIEAKETLQHNWRQMVRERCYVAVVEGGAPEPPEGVVESYLAENAAHEVYSTADPAAGKRAVTRYRTLRASGAYALVECRLDTGRKNQIRVHMKDLGHPIAGDRRYGAGTSPLHRLCLHARTLRFVHPVTRRELAFDTPVPAGFTKLAGRPLPPTRPADEP